MTTPFTCPDCGAPIELYEGVVVSEAFAPGFHYTDRELPRRERLATMAACTGCEFAIEVKA